MRADTLDSYVKRASHYYLTLTLISFIWLIVKFGYATELGSVREILGGSPSFFMTKFVFLSLYISIAIAAMVVYQLVLRNSDNFIKRLKRYGGDSGWNFKLRKYKKKRNKLLTTNLFVFLISYIILVNYGLYRDGSDFWQYARLSLPVLAFVIMMINVITTRRILRAANDEIYQAMSPAIYDGEPQLDTQYWKLSYLYYNTSDERIIVNRPSGVGWTINHAHTLPAAILYSGTILMAIIAVLYL